MLRYLYGSELDDEPALRDAMLRDRADQFHRRLGWDVTVDQQGRETDDYDRLNPLYVIWQRSDGSHGGSMRFLPTTGRTMVADHFAHLANIGALQSPAIWECTRFCLAPDAAGGIAGALMLGGGELMRRYDLRHFLGVFDARMVRVYRQIGAPPVVLGSRNGISVGLWSYDPATRNRVASRAGIAPEQSAAWLEEAGNRRYSTTPTMGPSWKPESSRLSAGA